MTHLDPYLTVWGHATSLRRHRPKLCWPNFPFADSSRVTVTLQLPARPDAPIHTSPNTPTFIVCCSELAALNEHWAAGTPQRSQGTLSRVFASPIAADLRVGAAGADATSSIGEQRAGQLLAGFSLTSRARYQGQPSSGRVRAF
jgi:hypothetical protein